MFYFYCFKHARCLKLKILFKNRIFVFQFLRIFVAVYYINRYNRKKNQLKKLINFYVIKQKCRCNKF